MAPVKPMGTDSHPKTKPGVTGFHQEYNHDPGPQADLNPAAVTDQTVLPPAKPRASAVAKVRKPSKARK